MFALGCECRQFGPRNLLTTAVSARVRRSGDPGLAQGLGFRVTWWPRGLSRWVISRVISTLNGVTLIITLLVTDLLSPLGLQVGFRA